MAIDILIIISTDFYNDYTWLFCDGNLGCYSAEIYDFDCVDSNGMDSCFGAIISNTKNIIGNGFESLKSSKIYAIGNKNNMTVNNYLQAAFVARYSITKTKRKTSTKCT